VIEEIGPHRVRCGDVTDGLADLMRDGKADLTWVDPPWGRGALRMFETLNHRQTGEQRQPIPFGQFMARLFEEIVTWTDGYVVIEYGITWREDLQREAHRYGLYSHGRAEAQYRTGGTHRPYDVHIFATDRRIVNDLLIREVKNKAGYRAVEPFGRVLRPGMTVLDPCCGFGLAARLAVENDCVFRGNELNAVRLGRAKRILESAVSPQSA